MKAKRKDIKGILVSDERRKLARELDTAVNMMGKIPYKAYLLGRKEGVKDAAEKAKEGKK
jgi:hypothetical protein